MAVLGNIPSLVINTFVALNIVLDKQWRIQLSFMCKHHHTVLSRSTAHFLKKFKLEIHTKRSEDSSGGEKTKPPRYLQRSFCFLTVTFSSSVAVEFTGRKWDMTMGNCSKPISSREPTSFWCWFLYHNQNKPMYRLVLTNAISAFSCLFWLKKRITINNDNPKLFILIQWMKISPYCGKIKHFFPYSVCHKSCLLVSRSHMHSQTACLLCSSLWFVLLLSTLQSMTQWLKMPTTVL